MKKSPYDTVTQHRDLLIYMEDQFRVRGRLFIAYLLRVVIEAIDEEFQLISKSQKKVIKFKSRMKMN